MEQYFQQACSWVENELGQVQSDLGSFYENIDNQRKITPALDVWSTGIEILELMQVLQSRKFPLLKNLPHRSDLNTAQELAMPLLRLIEGAKNQSNKRFFPDPFQGIVDSMLQIDPQKRITAKDAAFKWTQALEEQKQLDPSFLNWSVSSLDRLGLDPDACAEENCLEAQRLVKEIQSCLPGVTPQIRSILVRPQSSASHQISKSPGIRSGAFCLSARSNRLPFSVGDYARDSKELYEYARGSREIHEDELDERGGSDSRALNPLALPSDQGALQYSLAERELEALQANLPVNTDAVQAEEVLPSQANLLLQIPPKVVPKFGCC